MMETLFGKDKNKPFEDNSPSMAQARQLKDWLVKRKECRRKPNLRVWAQSLEKLGQESPDVGAVLAWYMDNADGKRLPAIESAPGFCAMYGRIRKAMRSDPGLAKLSVEQSRVYGWTSQRYWPATFDRQLPLVIQRSWENYEEFRPIVYNAEALMDRNAGTSSESTDEERKEANKARRARRLLLHLKETHFSSRPREFVMEWICRLQETLESIPSWKGSVEGLIFNWKGDRFQRLAEAWTYAYCEDSSRWQLVMGYLKEAAK